MIMYINNCRPSFFSHYVHGPFFQAIQVASNLCGRKATLLFLLRTFHTMCSSRRNCHVKLRPPSSCETERRWAGYLRHSLVIFRWILTITKTEKEESLDKTRHYLVLLYFDFCFGKLQLFSFVLMAVKGASFVEISVKNVKRSSHCNIIITKHTCAFFYNLSTLLLKRNVLKTQQIIVLSIFHYII